MRLCIGEAMREISTCREQVRGRSFKSFHVYQRALLRGLNTIEITINNIISREQSRISDHVYIKTISLFYQPVNV